MAKERLFDEYESVLHPMGWGGWRRRCSGTRTRDRGTRFARDPTCGGWDGAAVLRARSGIRIRRGLRKPLQTAPGCGGYDPPCWMVPSFEDPECRCHLLSQTVMVFLRGYPPRSDWSRCCCR